MSLDVDQLSCVREGSSGAGNLRAKFENMARAEEEGAEQRREEERKKREARERKEKEQDEAIERVSAEKKFSTVKPLELSPPAAAIFNCAQGASCVCLQMNPTSLKY